MRLVIEIPDALHREFRDRCIAAGVTQASIVRGLIADWSGPGSGPVTPQKTGATKAPKELSKQAQAAGKTRK